MVCINRIINLFLEEVLESEMECVNSSSQKKKKDGANREFSEKVGSHVRR